MAADSRGGARDLTGSGAAIRAYRPGPDDAAVVALWHDALGETWPAPPDAIRERVRPGRGWIAEDGTGAAGFIATHARGPAGQVTVLLVRPDARRRGLGTRLLNAATADLQVAGVSSLTTGSGAGPYFWPGVPENLPAALSFFRARGWELGEQTADMEADLAGYATPGWILDRERAAGVAIAPAGPRDRAEVLAFEREHFPEWHDYFVAAFDREDPGVLAARTAPGGIAGTVLVDLPSPGFVWEPLLPGAGAFGCVGVAEAHRERGIGMALCARSHERLAAAGVRRAFLGWVVLVDWYAKLGYRPWRAYRGGARPLI